MKIKTDAIKEIVSILLDPAYLQLKHFERTGLRDLLQRAQHGQEIEVTDEEGQALTDYAELALPNVQDTQMKRKIETHLECLSK